MIHVFIYARASANASPTIKNYTPEVSAFEILAEVNSAVMCNGTESRPGGTAFMITVNPCAR